jgi:hypothetical protein
MNVNQKKDFVHLIEIILRLGSSLLGDEKRAEGWAEI